MKIESKDLKQALHNLMGQHTPEELSQMTPEEIQEEIEDHLDEIHCDRMQSESEARIYGDDRHEEYLLSDEYENDCKMEKWDWIKNA